MATNPAKRGALRALSLMTTACILLAAMPSADAHVNGATSCPSGKVLVEVNGKTMCCSLEYNSMTNAYDHVNCFVVFDPAIIYTFSAPIPAPLGRILTDLDHALPLAGLCVGDVGEPSPVGVAAGGACLVTRGELSSVPPPPAQPCAWPGWQYLATGWVCPGSLYGP